MEFKLQPRRNLLKAFLSSIVLALALVWIGLPNEAVVFSVAMFILVFLCSTFIDMIIVLLEYRKNSEQKFKTKDLIMS